MTEEKYNRKNKKVKEMQSIPLEDEKEAKKIRRILANRESARESIRRRQAIHDELTKRVSDLSSDHDKLKMEKELAMQENMSLEETNKQLKEQMAIQGVAISSASQQMEDEKEAKRTICDEPTKRVSDLSSDNDKLKMHVHWKPEKELAMQEYMSLEQTDKKLKEQIAKTVRPEVQGASSSAASQRTESEKEAKKIRRILANRVFARESRRRRQAIDDELTKRVSDLSSENDKLKMEKELVMQEYMSFKETNKQLKEQIANKISPEDQEAALEEMQ